MSGPHWWGLPPQIRLYPMIRWARAGITRVEHVLTEKGEIVTNCDALIDMHPRLLAQIDDEYIKGRVTQECR